MSTIPFADLTPEQKLKVLGWMREGVDKGIKMSCDTRAHHALVLSIHGGPAFDPVAVWENFGESIQEHFEHAAPAQAAIDAAIVEAELELASAAPPIENAPEPTRSTKSTKSSPLKPVKKKRPDKKKRR